MLRSIIISFVLTSLLFWQRRGLKEFYDAVIVKSYLGIKYGPWYKDFYYTANITEFPIAGLVVKRGWIIKFYIPSKERYVEGYIIGVDEDQLLYVKELNGDIALYTLAALQPENIVHINNRSSKSIFCSR